MFLYTALGDSITAGANATSPALAYPSQVVSVLRHSGVAAVGEVLAQPGWTSAALLTAVLDNSSAFLAQANVVSVWIGGDDIAYAGLAIQNGAPKRQLLAAYRGYAAGLAGLIASIRKVSSATIIVCTQYNPFPNSPLATQAIAALNGMTGSVAARHHVRLVPAHEWFAGREAELISGYRTGRLTDVLNSPVLPLHPNNRGHKVIANGLLPYVR